MPPPFCSPGRAVADHRRLEAVRGAALERHGAVQRRDAQEGGGPKLQEEMNRVLGLRDINGIS